MAYPFGGGFSESCGCKFHCVPQFGARYDAIAATRSKVGFSEFGSASSPPRKFLVRHTMYRAFKWSFEYGVETWNFWERTEVDIDTGAATTTDSTPSLAEWDASLASSFLAYVTDFPGGADAPVVDEHPSYRKTVYFRRADPLPVIGLITRLEVLETLESEYTTPILKEKTEAALPAWSAFPADPPDSGDGIHAYYVQSGICYSQGIVWNVGPSRLIIPNYRHLTADELTYTAQRMRYKVVFPEDVIGSFTVAWDEVFVSEGGALADGQLAASAVCVATTPDAESDLLEAVEWRENGEVFVSNVRFAA